MNDVAVNFVDIAKFFLKKIGNSSNIPLFSSCTKNTKISIVFKLYSMKAKNAHGS
jgi:hypothetical protein